MAVTEQYVTGIRLTALPNPSSWDQTVTLTVTAFFGDINTPTGTVTFSDGSTLLGTSMLQDGSCTRTLPPLSLSLGSTYDNCCIQRR